MRPLASPGKRIAAFGLDYLVIVSYGIALFLLTWIAFGPRAVPTLFGWNVDVVAFGTFVLPVILYFSFSEASTSGGTWGKRRVGIRVVGNEQMRLSFAQSFLRSCVKFAPWQIAHTCLFHIPGWPLQPDPTSNWLIGVFGAVGLAGLSVLGLFVSRSRRTLYDLAAGTTVISAG